MKPVQNIGMFVAAVTALWQVEAMAAEEVNTVPPVDRWYAGGSIGVAYLRGWDPSAMDSYYQSRGYVNVGGLFGAWMMDTRKAAGEVKVYGGYRPLDFMDVEVGYSSTGDWESGATYSNFVSAGQQVHQRFSAKALYVSASFRPVSRGYGHGLFLKAGVHASELKAMTTLNGQPMDVNAIGLGDRIPSNGTHRGGGALLGIGFDFRTGTVGAVRLEANHYNRLGGTSFDKNSLNVGFHANF